MEHKGGSFDFAVDQISRFRGLEYAGTFDSVAIGELAGVLIAATYTDGEVERIVGLYLIEGGWTDEKTGRIVQPVPTPRQLAEFASGVIDRIRRISLPIASEECQLCSGSGWEIIECRGLTGAKRCRCGGVSRGNEHVSRPGIETPVFENLAAVKRVDPKAAKYDGMSRADWIQETEESAKLELECQYAEWDKRNPKPEGA